MAHYFESQPNTDSDPKTLAMRFYGHEFRFKTDHDVFSRHGLDAGTKLLLDTVLAQEDLHGQVLDLGCGYGPVGIILKRVQPHLELTMADINARAVDLARSNCRLNHVAYAHVIQSDGLSNVEGCFSTILLNPPIRAGKVVVYRLFAEAMERLMPQGRLYVVIRKKQGAESAQRKLAQMTDRVQRINRSSGYWILCAEKGKPVQTG